jgi:NAD(P)-dependent dehydrogenase (short-subunit alcohol dehydrogenase family)
MTINLDGATCLVTGAASGLGRAMTLGLLRAGAQVAGLDMSEGGLSSTALAC